MQNVDLEHTFDATPSQLWEAVWDPRLLGWMCARLSALEKRDVVSETVRADGRTHRIVRSQPRDRIPSMARHVLSAEMLAWEEEQVFFRQFRPDDPRIEFTITPSSGLRSLFSCKGAYTVTAIDGGRRSLRRIHAQLEVRAGILVNKLAESYLQKEISRSLDEEAGELVKFLKEHPPA
jgi:hypothetical protein